MEKKVWGPCSPRHRAHGFLVPTLSQLCVLSPCKSVHAQNWRDPCESLLPRHWHLVEVVCQVSHYPYTTLFRSTHLPPAKSETCIFGVSSSRSATPLSLCEFFINRPPTWQEWRKRCGDLAHQDTERTGSWFPRYHNFVFSAHASRCMRRIGEIRVSLCCQGIGTLLRSCAKFHTIPTRRSSDLRICHQRKVKHAFSAFPARDQQPPCHSVSSLLIGLQLGRNGEKGVGTLLTKTQSARVPGSHVITTLCSQPMQVGACAELERSV